ncbi:MAG: hypothetical protein LBB08_01980, partial [Rickettsiales bacterium]|nr:hypothetical protein [Rickettsiales bacterium]
MLFASPLHASAPTIATKGYVDSGLATRVSNTIFASFKTNAESFQNRADGFATAVQGAKADSAYQKPASGILKTDLATAVQTSLGKADSAVQSVGLASGTNNGTVKL